MNKIVKMAFVGATLLTSANAFAADSKFLCDKPIIEAVTANGKKEVKICISGNGVSYTFGRVDEYRPELDIKVPRSATLYRFMRYERDFELRNGNYLYAFTYSIPSEESVSSKATAVLDVYNGSKHLAAIKLGKIITEEIGGDLENYGIREDN